MYPAPFDYYAPTTMSEALALLSRHGDSAKLLAGGHSLLPLMKLRLAAPPVLIDLGRVAELAGIREEPDALTIGAMTTHQAVQISAIVKRRIPLLAEVASQIGDIQVRNRGTIGGSVVHADPAADWPAAMVALEAQMIVRGTGEGRTIPASDFFVDAMTTGLEPDEILTAIRVPVPPAGGSAYAKVRQPASGFAIVGIAVQLAFGPNGVCERAAIGLTGLGARAVRARASETALEGRRIDNWAMSEAADRVAGGIDPLEDQHASGEFRVQLARVHLRRALARAAAIRHE